MSWEFTVTMFAVVLATSWGATGVVRLYLARRRILDHPNPRSSHDEPTPRGGGIALIAVLVPALLVIGWTSLDLSVLALAGFLGPAVLLAVVSWRDDTKGLGPLPRLTAQIGAVAVGLLALPVEQAGASMDLPVWLVYWGAGLAWVWFINLFNFMDGIDGITGVEAACIGAGLFLVGLVSPPIEEGLGLCGLAVAAAALGFLWWNWQPARIFMGDVGSVPLGYLLGWLLLYVASTPLWPAALILPLYYLADSTITLLRRLLRGERVWRAHKEHFYQRAIQGGRSHAQVARLVLACNGLLVGLAAAAALVDWWFPLAGAAVVVGILLRQLSLRPMDLA